MSGMRLAATVSVLAALTACGPSCEDQGGELKFSHFMYVYQPALKMAQPIPQYRCILESPTPSEQQL